MNKMDLIRAWKDPLYRASLSAEKRASLPQHPAGLSELNDDQLRMAAAATTIGTTAPTCTAYTFLGWKSCCPSTTV